MPNDTYLGDGLIRTQTIGDIRPHILIRDQARFKNEITRHPVQTGSPISDHVYRQPTQLALRLAWSPSTPGTDSPTIVQDMYAKLIALKDSGEVFPIVTSKMTYKDMMVEELVQVTDEDSYYALIADVDFLSINYVNTQTLILPPSFVMAYPALTRPPLKLANKNLIPTDKFNTNAPVS